MGFDNFRDNRLLKDYIRIKEEQEEISNNIRKKRNQQQNKERWARYQQYLTTILADKMLASAAGSSSEALLLDLFPNAAAAYSLRKLRTAYTGNAIRVRKEVSLVDEETDIGFDANGNLDTTSLLSFASDADGGNVYVSIWYDQTTSDPAQQNNATNANESQQPLIVSGGSIIYEGATTSRPAIQFDGVDDKLGFASNLNIGGSPSIIGVLNIAAGDVAWRGGGSDYWYFQASQIWRYRNGDFDATWFNTDGLPVLTGSQKLIATYKNSTSVELSVDGTNIATKSSGTGTDGEFNYIGSDVLYMDGVWQELIIYTSDQSGNRTGIETNINDHFNIYTL